MSCSGSPWPCSYHGPGLCNTCRCTWDEYYEECIGTPRVCVNHDNQADCEDCGCEWEVALNVKLNIGDVWKDATELKINIGDVWKDATEIWINIGDVWKRVF